MNTFCVIKKKILQTVLLYAVFSIVPLSVSAAIIPQYAFEDNIPSFIKLDGNGSISISDYKFKEGKKSMYVNWEKGAKLVFDETKIIQESMLSRCLSAIPMFPEWRFPCQVRVVEFT